MNAVKTDLFLLFFFLIAVSSFAQEINIEKQLKEVESGDFNTAAADLETLKQQYPDNPSVMYLDALLTKDGKTATEKYKSIWGKYPTSKYADAVLFQIYSYYFAFGNYTTANNYLEKLQTNFPSSSYLKAIDNRNVDEKLTISNKNEKDENTNTPKLLITKKEVYKFTVQAGAFLVQDNAEKLKKTFLDNGFTSEVKEKKIGGSNFFIVNVGKFTTNEEAKTFLLDLRKNAKIDGRIVSLE
ncbi:MAG: SPOR domain-containing protein [Ignavibacteriales bacterium]|nr:SPOR domain-containing protein [Ignavibacteriales bacterium]